MRVLHVVGDEHVVDDARALQRVFVLVDDLLPCGFFRMVDVDLHDAVARRFEIGEE